jgi:hypothetical protein
MYHNLLYNMQRVSNDIDEIEITVCDEDCLPYREPDDNKEDEEWDIEEGRYSKPIRYRRRFIYHASAFFTFAFSFTMIYWCYNVMYYHMDYNDTDQ